MDLVCLSYFLFLHAIPDKYDDDDQISVWSTSCSQTPCANKMYVCGGVWVCVCVCVCVCIHTVKPKLYSDIFNIYQIITVYLL